MVGRSKDKNETEPVPQIKFTILKDGTIVTDSDYLPNDVNERAHDAMDVLEQLLGNKRVMTKKPIPAKYAAKSKPSPSKYSNYWTEIAMESIYTKIKDMLSAYYPVFYLNSFDIWQDEAEDKEGIQ